jgi:propanediol dehydratase small subunit
LPSSTEPLDLYAAYPLAEKRPDFVQTAGGAALGDSEDRNRMDLGLLEYLTIR